MENFFLDESTTNNSSNTNNTVLNGNQTTKTNITLVLNENDDNKVTFSENNNSRETIGQPILNDIYEENVFLVWENRKIILHELAKSASIDDKNMLEYYQLFFIF